MADAGVERGQVDGLLVGDATTLGRLMPADLLAEQPGSRPRRASGVSVGGATGLSMVVTAAGEGTAVAATAVAGPEGTTRSRSCWSTSTRASG
jgi:acetyl-CoA C-acetyltransferase